jgi:hypothetical protein
MQALAAFFFLGASFREFLTGPVVAEDRSISETVSLSWRRRFCDEIGGVEAEARVGLVGSEEGPEMEYD